MIKYEKITLLTLLVISACNVSPTNSKINSTTGLPNSVVETITIENCEYWVVNENFGQIAYVHKGNCKNPIHTCNPLALQVQELNDQQKINDALKEKVNQQRQEIEDLERQRAIDKP